MDNFKTISQPIITTIVPIEEYQKRLHSNGYRDCVKLREEIKPGLHDPIDVSDLISTGISLIQAFQTIRKLV